MSRFILLMLSCRWYEGVFSGCLLIKWNKTNLQCLKSGWTKTSCAIQLWSIVACFRNFANDRVVHGSFLNPLIWTSDLKRCSNLLTVGGQVFLHSDALKHLSLWDIALHSRVFSTHPHLLHFRSKNAWDVNEPAFISLRDERIGPLWRASHQRGQKKQSP